MKEGDWKGKGRTYPPETTNVRPLICILGEV